MVNEWGLMLSTAILWLVMVMIGIVFFPFYCSPHPCHPNGHYGYLYIKQCEGKLQICIAISVVLSADTLVHLKSKGFMEVLPTDQIIHLFHLAIVIQL